MKKLFSLLVLLTMAALTNMGWATERQLAFPGAEGYGRYVTGGRGGEVCYVTRLDDCSDSQLVEGTLRWAIRHDNGGKPRTILFATAGTIYLTSKLKFQYPDVSILGQSAPGGGITITGYNMYICKDNVIVRYLRFRAGDIPNTSMTGLDLENADRVILDHCSMTWSMEECLTAYDTDSTTIQWCIIGEGLYNSKNAKGARAYAMQWGGEHSTMHHTLITNSHSRAPRFNGVRSSSSKKGDHDYQVESEFANNVVFNCGNAYGGEYDKSKVEVNAWNESDPGYNRVYMINNYYRPGSCTQGCNNKKFVGPSSPYGQWYLNGNKFDLTTDWTSAKSELESRNKDNYYNLGIADSYKLTTLPVLSGMSYETAEVAYAAVTSKAGATLPRIDEVDQRLLNEAAGVVAPKYHGSTLPSQLGLIDSPDNITLSYPDSYIVNGVTYSNMPKMLFADDKFAIDSDADGMPDGYEVEKGFNKNDPTDGAALADNGYTNLENYLNGLVDGTVSKSKYETSTYMVEPGMTEIPEKVTITFAKGSETFEGNLPEGKTLAYGSSYTIPANYTLYKEGYTLQGWLCNGMLYQTGSLHIITRDLKLTPVFTQNKVQLADRQEDLIIQWDFTTSNSPSTVKGEGVTGIFTTQVTFSGASHDIVLRYDNNVFTVPACKGGSVQLNENAPVNITEEVSEYQLSGTPKRSALRSVTVKLPYNWNTSDRIYYTPQPKAGNCFELIYTTPEVAAAAEWIGGSYYEYLSKRTFFDPVKDDNATYTTLEQSLVYNASDRTLDMFITGTAKIVAYITNQSSNPNQSILVATPSDDSEPIQTTGKQLETKQTPEILELAGLDTSKSYRVRFVAVEDYDIALGAIKLYTTDPNADKDKCSLSIAASPAIGGTVSQTPAGASLAKGTAVQVAATAASGYFFVNWTDQNNQVVSTKAVYEFTLEENTSLTANFKNEDSYINVFADCAPFDAVVENVQGLKIALSKANGTDRYRIFLRNGEYDFGTVAKTAVKGNVSLIGESQEGVLIFNNPGSVTDFQNQTPVLFIDQNQNNVYMQDLTIRQARDWASKTSQGQALALRQRGKQAIYKNVTLQGVQDTYYLNKADATAYFEDCTVAGEVDFIYGDGTMFFEHCTLNPVSSSAYITAPNTQAGYKGIVFNECRIARPTDAKNAVTGYKLGRPWGDSPAATFINTTMEVLPSDAGWGSMTKDLVLRFHEYGSKDANGQLLDLSKRSIAGCSAATGSDSPVITEAQAAEYALDKVFPAWTPATHTIQLTAPVPQTDKDGLLSWTAVDGAAGYAIVCDGSVIGFTTATSYTTPQVGTYSLRVVNAMGGLGQASTSVEVTYTGIETLSTLNSQLSAPYDLMGRQVTAPRSGQILLHNGKVVIVK